MFSFFFEYCISSEDMHMFVEKLHYLKNIFVKHAWLGCKFLCKPSCFVHDRNICVRVAIWGEMGYGLMFSSFQLMYYEQYIIYRDTMS